MPSSFLQHLGTLIAKSRDARNRVEGTLRLLQQPADKNKNYKKETMMRNEIKIVEDGVIFELEIEEVEEVVAPSVLINT